MSASPPVSLSLSFHTHESKPIWLSTPSYTHLISHHPTLLSLLQTCKSTNQLKQIHAHLFTTGLIHHSFTLSTLFEFSAVSQYKDIDYALELFTRFHSPTLFTYNTIIRSLSTSQIPHRSMHFFLDMLCHGISPDKYTYPFLLKSLPIKSALFTGKTLHGHALKMGCNTESYVESSLISFYSRRHAIEDARKLFDRITERNVVCWSAMISGLVQGGRFREALGLFSKFQFEGFDPNESSLVSVLCTSAHLGALENGRWIHMYVKKHNVALSVKIGTALIDMYCKCGVVEEALKVFDDMSVRNLCSWTALICGLAINGMSNKALDVFEEMLRIGVRPDSVTFVGVLTACSHGGLVDVARRHFDGMRKEYRILPQVEHYGCMIDVYGRAGLLNDALELIEKMVVKPDVALWGALLNACRLHKNIDMGEFVGRHLIELDPLNDANYVLLSNIYAQGERWGDAVEVRKLMRHRGVKKSPGCSVIEVDGVVHEFFVNDKWDPRFEELRPMLVEMGTELKAAGYVPSTSEVLLDINEDEKRDALCYHSEKLAIAFGLINTAPMVPIRIVKNLRACADCHSATKIISKVFNREIVVRDRLRFHHFKNGACSCLDYW